MAEKGKYIYGILFNLTGDTPTEIHVEEEKLEVISYKDISAAVSNAEVIDYSTSCKDVFARLLLKHQKIIEQIMDSGYTVFPMKIASCVNNNEQVVDLLKNAYNLVKTLKKDVNNNVEVDIVATWKDFSRELKAIGENGTIKETKERLMENPENITLADQQGLGILISKFIKLENQKCSKKCYDFLKDKIIKFKVHDVMNDEMIFNTSFLIDKNNLELFNKTLDELDEHMGGRINFRYVGPLPCYSFYSLELVVADFNQLNNSRELLGLNKSAGLSDIKKAYRMKAVINHPDKKNEIRSNEDFDEINKAYKMLIDYYSARKNADPDFDKCNFTKENVLSNPYLVKLRE